PTSAPPAGASTPTGGEPSVATSVQPSAAAVALPDDLPVDVPDGGQVNGVFPPTAGTMQSDWVVRVIYPPGGAEEIAAFYDAWFASTDLEIQATATGSRYRWVNRTEENPLTYVALQPD